MENIKFTLSEIHRTLTSINAYLAAFAEEVETKKKKFEKKKNYINNKKRNIIYIKKKDGGLMIDPDILSELNPKEEAFYKRMLIDHPSICNMIECLTFKQYDKLCNVFDQKIVNIKIAELDNNTNIESYKSAYKTVRNWLNRDKYARRYS